MRTFYIKFLLLIIIVITLIKIVDSYCIQDEFFYTAHKKFLNKKEKYDFLFMGNSLSQGTYNASYIDSIYNSKSICIGGSAHHFYITNLIFNEFIEDKKLHPNKLLIIEIGTGQFKEIKTEKLKFLQMAALDEIEFSTTYFKTISKFYEINEYPKVFSSTIRFHNELLESMIETQNKLKIYNREDIRGFDLNSTNKLSNSQKNKKKDFYKIAKQYATAIDQAEEVEIGEENESIIRSMINKCREQKINLLFVTAPSINTVYNIEDYGKMKYIEKLLASEKAKHINFNRAFNTPEFNITFDDFKDYSHLNTYGNKKITPLLVNYINENFDISKNSKTKIQKTNNTKNNIKVPMAPKSIDINKWGKIRISLTKSDDSYHGNRAYELSRANTTESSYLVVKNQKGDMESRYNVSIVAKKGDKGDRLGLRISGKYPNRVDAIFDLQKGNLVGVTKNGNFENEFADIKDLGEGWFQCILTAKVNTDQINIILGPTDNKRTVEVWEGNTETMNNILIVPSSIQIKERKNRFSN